MKKVIIFTAIIVSIFALLAVVTNMQNTEKAKGNPYNKETLHTATIEQLDNPLYSNLILPEELEQKLNNGESLTVYFYSPTCPHCVETTPVVVPLADSLNIDLKMFNLLEFRDGWDEYNIESTPTIVHFNQGKEEKRIVGEKPEQEFSQWFNEIN